MKWLVFTGACVAALVGLGVLAVDERDVVWEGRRALCPYCRSELPNLAHACKQCDRTVDWKPATETCRHCLDAEDVRHLKNAFLALKVNGEPLPGALASFPRAYFEVMEPGACTYCAGLRKVLDAKGAEVVCPVCRGSGRCIACDGDRSVVLGDPVGHRRLLEREEVWARAAERSEITGLPLSEQELVDEDVRSLAGYIEAESLNSVIDLLLSADERIREAFAALHAEHASKSAAPETKEGS